MKKKTTTDLAPIALFVYKRPEHTLQTLTSIAKNPEFLASPLYIYCDGAKNPKDQDNVNRTRNIIRNWEHPNKFITEHDVNQGLANSIINGVSAILKEHGSIIVVEDDLIVSKFFLNYLNNSLRIYQNSPQVMQISAHMFEIPEFSHEQEALFLPFISSWGWATWERAWEHFDTEAQGWEKLLTNVGVRKKFNINGNYDYSNMLFQQIQGEIDSWAIRWNWSVFKQKGLVLYPPNSLVLNIGFDGSGTHCRTNFFHTNKKLLSSPNIAYPQKIEENKDRQKTIQERIKKTTRSKTKRILKSFRNTTRRLILKYLGR